MKEKVFRKLFPRSWAEHDARMSELYAIEVGHQVSHILYDEAIRMVDANEFIPELIRMEWAR